MQSSTDKDRWIKQGKLVNASFLVVMCDEYDFTYYPKYVMPNEDLNSKIQEFEKSDMQTKKEIIKL